MDIAQLVSEYGFPTIMVVGLGYFVFFVWKFINEEIQPEIDKQHIQLIKVIDRMRMLDQDLIRLQQKVDVVLKLKEVSELKESIRKEIKDED
jgi:hypothetical protein|tara:strand:+ start:7536 stop:7811 length:276 start_codon:yes stop_codon:yes gene_type:complete